MGVSRARSQGAQVSGCRAEVQGALWRGGEEEGMGVSLHTASGWPHLLIRSSGPEQNSASMGERRDRDWVWPVGTVDSGFCRLGVWGFPRRVPAGGMWRGGCHTPAGRLTQFWVHTLGF